jgi:hypothetical protein
VHGTVVFSDAQSSFVKGCGIARRAAFLERPRTGHERGEALGWPVGLARQPLQAKGFYATIVIATLSGTIICFSPLDPIKALFWSAVTNGVGLFQ